MAGGWWYNGGVKFFAVYVVVLVCLLWAGCWRDVPDAAQLGAGAVGAAAAPLRTAATPVPTSAPLPTAIATAGSVAASAVPAAPAVADASVAPREDPPARDLLALAQRFGRIAPGDAPAARTLPADPACCAVGHTQDFFVTDLIRRRVYTVEARLLAVSENAYWYADVETELTAQELEQTADVFEREIRPPIVEAIGDIWRPGVDGDDRLTVLHTPLVAAAGYFSAADQFPRSAQPRSNEREMIFMDGDWLRPGSRDYFAVLAHEFQHAAHWNLDRGEDVWVNEGMSEAATEIVGFRAGFVDAFMEAHEAQLNFWPEEPRLAASHYGGSALFIAYLAEHYGGYGGLAALAGEPLDGVNGVERYLSQFGKSFLDVFGDWVVANYLDARLDGRADGGDSPGLEAYRYSGRGVGVQRVTHVDGEFRKAVRQPQLTARYYEIRLPDGDALVEFEGDATVAQVGTECRSGRFCWWGGNGDSIDTTLEREFDLSALDDATLEFWMWHDIEEDWDYAYVSVSTDGGASWTTLDGQRTTREDPLGANYGAGITGKSVEGGDDGWARERMDLSPYVGAGGDETLVRFEYITDEGVNFDGIVIDDIAIPQLGFVDDAETGGEWQANGFHRIDNTLPQGFALRLIEFGSDGGVSVHEPPSGSFRVEGFGSRVERAVLVVAPTTYTTYRRAGYMLAVEPVGIEN